tara:strand:- start:1125 stop:1589 length:465 start_codon:yes stop_codon:yes gene_type:complete
MSRKTDLISLLVTELKRIDKTTDSRAAVPHTPYTFKSNVNGEVYDTFKFMDQINDFPTICLNIGSEARSHIGAGVKYGEISLLVRGYVRDENVLEVADDLLEDIEHILESLSHLTVFCDKGLVESRIISLVTDEGLFDPWGIIDINALLIYEVE